MINTSYIQRTFKGALVNTCIYILFLLSSYSFGESRDFLDYSLNMNESYQVNYGSLFMPESLSYQKIIDAQKHFKSYNEFILYLSKSRPSLFKKPVLIHTSGSLQYADTNHPRVILSDGNIFFGFAENPHNSSREVEIIEFDKNKKIFLAHEIVFPKNDKVQFLESPQKCTSCHGSPIRPLWKPYDIWPNTFGSLAETFSSDTEAAAYDAFFNQANSGIYSYISRSSNLVSAQNTADFTMMLASLNQIRVNKILNKRKSEIHALRYFLIAAFNGCFEDTQIKDKKLQAPEEFFSKNTIKNMLPYEFYKQDTIKARKKMQSDLDQQYFSIFNLYIKNIAISQRLDFENFVIAPVRWLLEPFGLYWREIAFADGVNNYSVQVPSNLIFEWSTGMAEVFNDLFVEMKPELQSFAGNNYKKKQFPLFNCTDLKLKSLEATKSLTIPTSKDILKNSSRWNVKIGLSPMSRCIKCHTDRTQIDVATPFIPFDHNLELKDWLQMGNNYEKTILHIKSGSMPKGSILNPDEKNNIIDSLNIIKNL